MDASPRLALPIGGVTWHSARRMTTPAAAPPPSEAVTINAVAGIARSAADIIRVTQLADRRAALMAQQDRIASMARAEAAAGVEASASYARVLLLQNNANIRAHNEEVRAENERLLQQNIAEHPDLPPPPPSTGKSNAGIYMGVAAVAVVAGALVWYRFGGRH
jgi:hypothetical protein